MGIKNKIKPLLAILMSAAVCFGVEAQEKFSRNIEQMSFVPKGQWIAGVSASYSQSNQNNYQFLIVEGVDGNTYSLKVSPTVLFVFKDNLAAGGKFSYSRSRTKLDGATVVVDSETDYSAENFYCVSQNYSTMAVFRNYINIGSTKRFGMFNEIQLEGSVGQAKLSNGKGTDLTGNFEDSYSLKVGVAPGLVMFLNNYSALEVNVGVLGFDYTHTKQTSDQVYVSNRSTKSANFKLNLFSISFGVVFYL